MLEYDLIKGERVDSEKGFRLKPRGTPWLSGIGEESLMVMNCFLLERCEYNQRRAVPVMPGFFS